MFQINYPRKVLEEIAQQTCTEIIRHTALPQCVANIVEEYTRLVCAQCLKKWCDKNPSKRKCTWTFINIPFFYEHVHIEIMARKMLFRDDLTTCCCDVNYYPCLTTRFGKIGFVEKRTPFGCLRSYSSVLIDWSLPLCYQFLGCSFAKPQEQNLAFLTFITNPGNFGPSTFRDVRVDWRDFPQMKDL